MSFEIKFSNQAAKFIRKLSEDIKEVSMEMPD